jgi:hypothetical protein
MREHEMQLHVSQTLSNAATRPDGEGVEGRSGQLNVALNNMSFIGNPSFGTEGKRLGVIDGVVMNAVDARSHIYSRWKELVIYHSTCVGHLSPQRARCRG